MLKHVTLKRSDDLEGHRGSNEPSTAITRSTTAALGNIAASDFDDASFSTASFSALNSCLRSFSASNLRMPQTCHSLSLQRCNSSKSSSNNKLQQQQQHVLRVYAKCLVADVEYVTLGVGANEKAATVVKLLLRKYQKLKAADPNLYYLTLERWIRKDGLRQRSVMLLGDNASPVQLQQCCSNPPYDDIKFTLQLRPAVLVQVYTNELRSDSKYKYISIASHTTVAQAIELLLASLNVKDAAHKTVLSSTSNNCDTTTDFMLRSSSTTSELMLHYPALTRHSQLAAIHARQTYSPLSTCSSISSSSSSSGFASEDFVMPAAAAVTIAKSSNDCWLLASDNNNKNCHDQLAKRSFELIVENESMNYRRHLHPDEFLAEVYQGLASKSVDDFAGGHNASQQQDAQNSSSQFKFKIVSSKPPQATPINAKLDFVPHYDVVDGSRSETASNNVDDDDELDDASFKRKLSLQTRRLLPVLSADKLLAARRGLKPAHPHSQPTGCRTSFATTTNLFLAPKLPSTAPSGSPPVAPRRRNSLSTTSFVHEANTLPPTNSPKQQLKVASPSSNLNRRRYDPMQLALDIERLTTIDEMLND